MANFLRLLDGFLVHKAKRIPGGEELEVQSREGKLFNVENNDKLLRTTDFWRR